MTLEVSYADARSRWRTNVRTKAVCVLLAIIAPAWSTAPAQEATREQYIAELVQAAGIESLLARTHERSAAEARRMVDGMLGQVGDLMARMPPGQRERVKAAIERFIAATTAPLDTK